MPPLLTPLLAEISPHDLEMAETLIGVARFVLIFVAARVLAEVLVRLQLPTILGELLAGVLIGASGLHLLVPPETQVELSQGLVGLVSGLVNVPPEVVPEIYSESFPSLESVAELGLYALLFLTRPGASRPSCPSTGPLTAAVTGTPHTRPGASRPSCPFTGPLTAAVTGMPHTRASSCAD